MTTSRNHMRNDRIEHLHIICYRWGTLYGPEYVNILRGMVQRNLSINHTFHCITDSSEGLHPDIITHELEDHGFDGIWRKLMTFQPNFLGLEGQFVVSLDLDIVIVDNIDFLAEQPEKDFMIARNWGRRKDGARGSGSVYRLKVGSHPDIWNDFIRDPERAIDEYHGKNRKIGEQNWLNAHMREFNYLPEGKVVSFKRHCKSKGRSLFGRFGERLGLTTAAIGKAEVPDGAAIISFHGDPSPLDVMEHRCGRWRHAPFVQEHWRTLEI